jgi:hypothetical protein
MDIQSLASFSMRRWMPLKEAPRPYSWPIMNTTLAASDWMAGLNLRVGSGVAGAAASSCSLL